MAMTTPQTYGAPAAKKPKFEHDASTPSTPQPASTPTQPPYSTAPQWSTQIPIDPTLQPAPTPMMAYQAYAAYNSAHYPQATYPHFAQYQPMQTPAASTSTITTATTMAPAATATTILAPKPVTTAPQPNGQEANVDISTLNDALGSAGVDLKAEEESLQRSQDIHSTYRLMEDRSRKQPTNAAFDTRILGTTMREIGTRHKVSSIPEDSVNYVALALRARLQGLVKAMIGAAEHRQYSQYSRAPSMYEDKTPMWSVVVRRDAQKQLEVLERVEREEEMRLRRERKERAEAAATAQAAQAAGSPSLEADAAGAGSGADDKPGADGAAAKKPKKKKDGPGVTARNMSEDVQKRLSNAVATQAAGIGRGKYAWMNAGAASGAAAAKAKASTPAPATAKETKETKETTATASTAAATTPSSAWAKPYVSTATKVAAATNPGDEDKMVVSLRDAMFIIERERGHGAGRGAARGWV